MDESYFFFPLKKKTPLVKYDINPSDSFLSGTTEIHCGGK